MSTQVEASCGDIPTGEIILADNLVALQSLPDACVNLIYIDPPFNTQKVQKRDRIVVRRSESGTRSGFAGALYDVQKLESAGYADSFDDFLAFLKPRLEEARRVLAQDGSFFLHLDSREVHYAKVLLDTIFGRQCFLNEIIWAYDYGGRSRTRWPAKHDTILWYVKNPESYTFNYDAIDRIPYMAPGLVGPAKAALGKVPTDVWWMTIVPTNSREKTSYPTQKPLKLLRRIVDVHSRPGDLVLDFFAGSGTAGEAAAMADRRYMLVDSSEAAVQVMARRLARFNPACRGW